MYKKEINWVTVHVVTFAQIFILELRRSKDQSNLHTAEDEASGIAEAQTFSKMVTKPDHGR